MDALAFLEKLVALLDSGRFPTTYKYVPTGALLWRAHMSGPTTATD